LRLGLLDLMLVQNVIDLLSDDVRLRRLACGKALPFVTPLVLNNLHGAGRKA
jgi:hypothetical protein